MSAGARARGSGSRRPRPRVPLTYAVEQLAALRVLQEHVVQALVRALAQAAQHVRVAQRAVQRRLAARARRLALRAHRLQRHGRAAARVH